MMTFCSDNIDLIVALTAMLAVLISFVSIIFTIISTKLQHRHNINSIRPIANIAISDYQDEIAVELINNGTGPLIIEKFKAYSDDKIKNNLIDFMPELPPGIHFNTFFKNFENFSIIPSKSIIILKYKLNTNNSEEVKYRDLLRKELLKLKVRVTYKDIYNKRMPINERSLDWFGRHFL